MSVLQIVAVMRNLLGKNFFVFAYKNHVIFKKSTKIGALLFSKVTKFWYRFCYENATIFISLGGKESRLVLHY
nr:MAG TPA: hypothetical protein [Caudoviricetes sp.]